MTAMNMVWFEIPVLDMDRAVAFHEAVFQIKLTRQVVAGLDCAFLPEDSATQGGFIKRDDFTPSTSGVAIYFEVGDEMEAVLERAAANGGRILYGKNLISPEIGYDAAFVDTEGNRVGLYSKT